MASMSIRGLDEQALARLKSQAEQGGRSLNSLVLRLLRGAGATTSPGVLQKFDDLDALAGTWSGQETLVFEHTRLRLPRLMRRFRPIALDTNACNFSTPSRDL